ncbi:MAG: hypothetical protein GWN84_03705 [Gammaproteobacteria bacterium]|nr:hypothetical protein [Gammaproteobacteria bacterium]NIU03293.1 hypothetical protein [Gammaproteobacteria bacterium]NIV50787.1 hypothetical protein [Gammaproteobacteria bacterium]NIX84568.1 hypothetical protein [Gammaproteobacteria bacterium]
MRQIFEYHPVIGFRFIPGLKARIPYERGGYLIRANATGFRNDFEFQREKRPGKRRVLLFGDSFTAGEGVSNGQRYGDYLEKLVPDLEVYNFALPATGTDQHYLIYREFASEMSHDAVIIAIFVENIRRVASRYRYFLNAEGKRLLYAKPYYTFEGDRLVLRGIPPRKTPISEGELSSGERGMVARTARFPRLKRLYGRLQRSPAFRGVVVDSGMKDTLLRMSRYRPITEYDDPSGPAWRLMSMILEQWITESTRPVLVMPIPMYHYVMQLADPSQYQQRFRATTVAAGGRFFDPLPAWMQVKASERRRFFYRDGHLTPDGNKALATAMKGTVKELVSASERRSPL